MAYLQSGRAARARNCTPSSVRSRARSSTRWRPEMGRDEIERVADAQHTANDL